MRNLHLLRRPWFSHGPVQPVAWHRLSHLHHSLGSFLRKVVCLRVCVLGLFWHCFGHVVSSDKRKTKPWIIVKSRLIKWRHIGVQMLLIGRDITWHPIGKLAGTHKQHATKWHIDPALPSEWYGKRKYQTFRSWPGMHSFWFWFAHRPLTNHRKPEKTKICWNTII